MALTLGELFARQNTDTVHHRGRVVKSLVRIPVRDGATVTVRRRQVGADRPQCVNLAIGNGALDVNGHRAPTIALWSHTSPEVVTLTVRGESATTLDVWNSWSVGGVDNAWIGNAGIVTKTTAAGTVLHCSDGVGPPDFTDLEIEITVER